MNSIQHRVLSKNFSFKTFCLLGLLAVVGTVGAARTYIQSQQKIVQTRYDNQITDKLYRIAEAQYVIRAVSRGKLDDVRQRLSFQIADDLADLRSSIGSANPGTRYLAEVNCARILRDEQTHPELYLAGSPQDRSFEIKAWEAAGREGLKAPNGHASPGGKATTYGMAENN